MASHWNVTCDGCESTTLIHYRYKCLQCANYDLCSVCYERKVESRSHLKTHPFQCLLDAAARELFYAGEEIPRLYADSFTCPICGEMGHSCDELVTHVESNHQGDKTAVICPLCIAAPSNEVGIILRSSKIASHVTLIHGKGSTGADPTGQHVGQGDALDYGLEFLNSGLDSPGYSQPTQPSPSPWELYRRLILSQQEALSNQANLAPLATPETLSDDLSDLDVNN